MKWLKNIFYRNENTFIKISIKDLCVGDVLRSGKIVTDKYRFGDAYRVWCRTEHYTIGKDEHIWIKQ